MKDPDQDPTVEYRPAEDAPTLTHREASPEGSPRGSSLVSGSMFGRFRIGRRLGQGGMGEVFEADDLDSGRRVALKILARPAAARIERSRFLREGRLAASINHPNCVYVFGTEEIDGHPVITMELVPEGTLRDRVAAEGPLEIQGALTAILEIIAGLEAAQGAGVLHRDVKPSNCFLDVRGGVKVGDFGLSVSAHGREDETQLTIAGTFLGTPAFASPEQLRGEPLDVRSDIYAVGATLYYLLTGRPPFDESNPVTLVAAILQADPASPAALRAAVPPGLGRVVLRCLAKSASARFQSYAELREALAPFVSTKQAPAELSMRLVAWLVDWSPWFAFSTTLAVSRLDILGRLSVMLASLGTYAAYFAVTEGLWGAGVGKRVARIRVVGVDGQPPGLMRATLRATVFALLPGAPNVVTRIVSGEPEAYWTFLNSGAGRLVSFSGLALSLALFATARRANGFAGLHELASGTRVVRRPERVARPEISRPSAAGAATADAPARVGPYEITGALDDRLLVGLDPTLGRKVWIRRGPAGEPPLPDARREIDRAGRLRWQSGRRTATESWDAYEAPAGAPLAEVAQQPQPWGTVRHWLLDLAEELLAGERDGTLPAAPGLAHVWITPRGGAKLLDFPISGSPAAARAGNEAAPAASAPALLLRIAGAALAPGDAERNASTDASPQVPLPLHARALLEDLAHDRACDLPGLIARLKHATGEPPTIGRPRRAAHLLCANFLVVLLLIPATVAVEFALDPRLAELNELATCMKALDSVDDPAEEEAIEIYIAGKFGSYAAAVSRIAEAPTPGGRAASPDMRGNMLDGALRATLDRAGRERLLSIYERHPAPSAEAVREAGQRMGGELTGRLEKQRSRRAALADPDLELATVGFVGAMLVACWSGWLAVLGGVFRGGPLLSLFGMAIVTRSGARASRARLFVRGLLLWLPYGLALLWAWIWVQLTRSHSFASGPQWTEIALLAAVPVAALLSCVLGPGRGLHDRMAGTYIVPR